MPTATVHANGIDLRVNRYRVGPDDQRPVVVFVHGLAVADHSGLSFTLGMPLANQADVVLYALRGHGHSQLVPSGYRVADHVADLVGLLDALPVTTPVHLVGCSFGGAVAVTAAVRHPERLASLILLDPLLPIDGWIVPVVAGIELVAGKLRDELTAEDAMTVLGLPSRRKATAIAERCRRLLCDTTLLDDLRDEPGLSVNEFAGIRAPVFAVYGDQSEMQPQSATLRRLVPGAQVHTVDDADHLDIYFRRARPVLDLLRQFLTKAEPTSGAPAAAGELLAQSWDP